MDHAGRYQWILAYFAEFSVLFEVDRVWPPMEIA